ncbi:hypothetical protein R1flu_011565 [Riccia fluitans]|uniref:Uncharacterized protein n=1 Tax=Riccia fluitans TaxID=41844 RepID=A0ABD1Z854_9MARC
MKFLAILILAVILGNKARTVSGGLVFAHYLIYAPDSVATYKAEIQLAQSKGIDAFALNTNVYRKNLFDQMYQAAQELGTGFKIFVSADIHADGNGRLSPADVSDMMTSYRTHPNQLMYNGKSFFTSWLGNDDSYWSFYGYSNSVAAWQDIFNQAGGKSLYFFIPFFPTDGSYNGVTGVLNTFGTLVDGYYGWDTSAWNYINNNFDTPGTSPGDATSLQACVDAGKTYMASVSAWFFKNLGGQQCCPSTTPSCSPSSSDQSGCPCQVKGNYQGSGLWLQHWTQIINNPPPLVEIVSWNDWIEGHYVSPNLSVGAASSGVDVAGFPHDAYLDLGKHYIDWYKTGTEPAPSQDSVYLFYYTQSSSVSISGQCSILHQEKLTDAVYAVIKLSPGPAATITINSGGHTTMGNATQGINVIGMGFFEGTQSVTFVRGSVTYTLTGAKQISNSGLSSYNYNVYSAFCKNVQNGACGS